MDIHGTRAAISRSCERFGYAIYLRKYENGKKFKPKKIDIEWAECNEYEVSEPLCVDHVDMYSSLDEESKLAGIVESQKGEISFLREELSKALAR